MLPEQENNLRRQHRVLEHLNGLILHCWARRVLLHEPSPAFVLLLCSSSCVPCANPPCVLALCCLFLSTCKHKERNAHNPVALFLL